jgi:hypothetical protein
LQFVIANGSKIEMISPDLYLVDQRYFIEVKQASLLEKSGTYTLQANLEKEVNYTIFW